MESRDWNARYAAAGLVWGDEPNRFVVEELQDSTPRGRALDLACGEGRNAIWLAERGWTVTGVDFSEVALERAKKLALDRDVDVEWLCADLTTYDPPSDAFALVLIVYLQLPEAELRGVVARAAAALEPEGELVMIGHALRNLAAGVGGPRDPAVLWTPDGIESALRAAGLRVLRCEHVRRRVETDDGTRDAIDVLARACRPG